MLLLLFSFLAGLVTILAPCIWPVLPIILSSVAGEKTNKTKPLGIAIGVMVSFAFFTLTLSYLVSVFHLDPNLLRKTAVFIIIFMGLTLIIPAISSKFEIFVTKLSNLFGQNNNRGSGFVPGLLTGFSLGIVWTPCAGPILATIAALAATGKLSLYAVLVTIFYVLGVGLPLFVFALSGQKLINRLRSINKFTPGIQKAFGILMILAAIAIYSSYDQKIQLGLINTFPALGRTLNGFENSTLVVDQLSTLTGRASSNSKDTSELFNINIPAPEFVGINKWLNTDKPLTISSLRGKVVLVDFWTYTCINCIRTLPHITSLYDKYKNDGLVVIGVHTPEFEFEKETINVQKAIDNYKIHYPVAQDNNYATWNNYANQFWPAEYLIDVNGNIRRTHFGEGEYEETEKAIQILLKDTGHEIGSETINMADQTPTQRITPETYLGSSRSFFNPDLKLEGDWSQESEFIKSGVSSSITYKFNASKVYIILRPSGETENKVRILLDGNIIGNEIKGTDVKDGEVFVDTDRLYNVVDLKDKTETHTLKLEFENPGIEAFTFTFG